jgi:hypothetical protein
MDGYTDSTASQSTEENILVMYSLLRHFLLPVSHTEQPTVKGAPLFIISNFTPIINEYL